MSIAEYSFYLIGTKNKVYYNKVLVLFPNDIWITYKLHCLVN